MSYRQENEELEEAEEEEGPQQVEQVLELSQATAPDSMKGIRACKRCGILKTLDQFIDEGCDNCQFLGMHDNPEKANLNTTPFFEGRVAVMDPGESWAARWMRVDAFLPGVYAIAVTGQFDRNTEEDLENRGARWRCRPAPST